MPAACLTSASTLRAGSATLIALLALSGCSINPGPTGVTKVVFDGETRLITGPITCTAQSDGGVLILASDDGQQTVRALLSRQHQLVVDRVGIRLVGAAGYTDQPDEMWATKVDETYTVDGWMPPNAGESSRHRFHVETSCPYELPAPNAPPPGNGLP